MEFAQIGVWMDREAKDHRQQYGVNVFELYAEEMLVHAGMTFDRIEDINEIKLVHYNIVIAALPSEQKENLDKLWNYMEQGGIVISFAGLTAFATKLGCEAQQESSVGYAELQTAWHQDAALRGFRLKPWKNIASAEYLLDEIGVLHRETPDAQSLDAVLQYFQIGKGKLVRWAVDLPYSIVMLQQGLNPVVTDGIPAPDGTAALDDWILKAEDECALDWQFDRKTTETGMHYYAHPYADMWKQAFAGHIIEVATTNGIKLPFVDYWPNGVDQVAMISHDSDHNIDESAELTLEVLRECDVQSTWCMIEPGYSEHLYEQIKADGHELAFHYNALEMDQGKWSEEEFARQFAWLQQATGQDKVKSNKNHYTRFEGWGELFDWCEQHGIESDQTRGPSKKGNIGFIFGTCHPYSPIAWVDQGNRIYNVVELNFLTQDLNHATLADTSVIVPFLEGVKKVRGVAHFLFHQVHILKQPEVRKAIKQVAEAAKLAGFVFWTGGEINDWYRAKRSIQIQGISAEGKVLVDSQYTVRDAVVWTPVGLNEQKDGLAELRFGMWCTKQVISVKKNEVTSDES